MKKTIITLLMCAAGIGAAAQTSSQNYILTRRMVNETAGDYTDLVTYYDGLGRPFEEVTRHTKQNSVAERHASLQEYDNLGRPVRSWLPASVTSDYTAPATLKGYAQNSSQGYNDTRPYTETVYELSTADRVMMQYGPGAAWYSAHPVTTQYTTNTASGVQSCKVYGVSGNSLTGGSTYHTAGTLHVVKTTDEDGRVSYTFTTGDGLTLLERRMNGTEQLDTYYVYDSLGRLRFVLQPMYQSTASTDQYAFEFRYNEKGLCTYRKNPGAQYVTYEYDWKDRLAYTQDGVQRSSGKWTFYTYDGVGRPSSQGENTSKASSTSAEYLKNYYDNYNFVGGTGFTSSLYTRDTSLSGWGKLTGQVISVLGGSTKIYVAYYYDAKGRVVRKVESNLLGGHEVTETTYTFTGKPSTVTHTHTASGKTTRTEKYTYVYDAAERVSSIKHKLGSTEIVLAKYTYDKHGRMARKSFHDNYSSEQIYSYNVRSWLTGISSAKFTQTLGYSGLYGGDIKTMSWTANGSSHSYTFGYDGVGRMMNANHGAGAYSELVTSYDKNGNIKALKRTCGSSTLADDLTYTYSGNRITKVKDTAGNSGLFKDGSTATTEYTYDNNGNLKSDLNKGISNITYNCLNLPLSMTFSNGSTIAYTYDANGRKLRTVHNVGGTTTTTDYAGNVIYENGVQKKLLTEEGYVDLTSGTYYYYLKDHQGNNRVVVNSGGTVQETNHYYPFGGTFASGTVQSYKYNGKELDTKAGLNWYDYGARHYDAALGRFTTQDPLAKDYYATSPYGYCLNNPVGAVDYEGKLIIFINGFAPRRENRASINYWTSDFVNQVKKQLNDNNVMFRHGGVDTNSKSRMQLGALQAIIDAPEIIKRITGESGNITETIKVISHSMGSSFAKGYIKSLQNYFEDNGLKNALITLEADFDPFQANTLSVIDNVYTQQFTHNRMFEGDYWFLANKRQNGINENNYYNDRKQGSHSITSFFNDISKLHEGTYIWNGEEWILQ